MRAASRAGLSNRFQFLNNDPASVREWRAPHSGAEPVLAGGEWRAGKKRPLKREVVRKER
jgi:hypothetical protein